MNYDPIDAQLHQAMTELSVVKGYAQLLSREAAKADGDTRRIQSYAARIQFEVDRLASTMAQLQTTLRSGPSSPHERQAVPEPSRDEG